MKFVSSFGGGEGGRVVVVVVGKRSRQARARTRDARGGCGGGQAGHGRALVCLPWPAGRESSRWRGRGQAAGKGMMDDEQVDVGRRAASPFLRRAGGGAQKSTGGRSRVRRSLVGDRSTPTCICESPPAVGPRRATPAPKSRRPALPTPSVAARHDIPRTLLPTTTTAPALASLSPTLSPCHGSVRVCDPR